MSLLPSANSESPEQGSEGAAMPSTAAKPAPAVTARKLLNAREREHCAGLYYLRAELALATHYAELQLHSNRFSRISKATVAAVQALQPGCARQLEAMIDEGNAVSAMRMAVTALYRHLELARRADRSARRAMDRLSAKASAAALAEFEVKNPARREARLEERLTLRLRLEHQQRLLEERRESGEEPADPDADRDRGDEQPGACA